MKQARRKQTGRKSVGNLVTRSSLLQIHPTATYLNSWGGRAQARGFFVWRLMSLDLCSVPVSAWSLASERLDTELAAGIERDRELVVCFLRFGENQEGPRI